MSHRCHDDWFWFSLLLIAFQSNNPRQSCCTDSPYHREWIDDDVAARYPAPAPAPPRSWSEWANGAVAVGLVGVVLWALITANPAPVPEPVAAPAPDAVVAAPPANSEPVVASVIPIASAGTGVSGLPESLALRLPDVSPLPSTSIPRDDAFTLAAIVAPDSTLLSTRFDIGSTREQVEAAQGRPPTYSADGGAALWWGSSKVVFTRSGRVERWVDGIPPLMIRR